MPAEINLLPVGKKPKPQVLKLSRTLRKYLKLFVVFLVLLVFGLTVSHYFINRQLWIAQDKQAKTKQQIQSLEQTEQRLFLLKDRLSKINEIINGQNANDEIAVLEYVNTLFDDNVIFQEADLSDDKIIITIKTGNSLGLASFIAGLTEKGNFKEVDLSSLEFSPESNYQAEFTIKR